MYLLTKTAHYLIRAFPKHYFFLFFQDLQTWAHGVYAPNFVDTNDTGLCVAQPGEPPAGLEMVAIMNMGFGRLVALYGPSSSVIWLPQGRDLPNATGGREELTVILGLTKKVGP